MRKTIAALVASFVLVLIPSISGAITGNGQPDTNNRYPFVGMLAFYDGDGAYQHRCSGTLMSSTVVVTAAHCTSGMSSARAYFDVEVTDDFRNQPTSGITGTPYTHPAYNPNTLDLDLAVVVLDQAVTLATYPELPDEGFLADLKASHDIKDDTFRAVGYGGVNGSPPPVITFDLIRRFVDSDFGSLTQNNLHLQQNPNVADGGTCFGDSGGPHFWKESLILASVTSWGDAICRSNDMTQRVDLAAALAFLAGFGLTPTA